MVSIADVVIGRTVRHTLSIAFVLLALYTLFLVRSTVLMFFTAVLFAYLLNPAVSWLQRRFVATKLPVRWTRPIALIAVYVLLVAVVVLMSYSVGSVIVAQVRLLRI